MKVGLITLHRVVNYGSVLQTYATQKTMEKLGHEVETIDYYPERLHMLGMLKRIKNKNEKLKNNILLRIACQLIILPSYIIRFRMFHNFLKKHIKMTRTVYKNEEELYKNIPDSDIYCTGSDQVWNAEWNEKIEKPYFLDFALDGKEKFSYAASFGKKELEEWEKEETKGLLEKYKNISMREKSGVEIVESLGIKNAIHVIDPTLLLDKEDWKPLISDKYEKEKYILVYNLNRNKNIDIYAEKIAKEKKLKIFYITYQLHEFYKSGKMKCNIKIEDFLALINNATYVITDSFHVTAFSINFNKQFMIVPPNKFSTRILSILELTGLENRIVKEVEDISLIEEKIDFNHANEVLKHEREVALEYLKKCLEIKK